MSSNGLDALAHLEAFLERAHPGFATDRGLHEKARALSRGYTEGVDGAAIAIDAASSLAYLAHFGPRAIAAVSYALSFVPGGVPRTCLDIGAGSGASALALAAAGATSVTLVERSAPALDTARKLLAGVTGVDARYLGGDVGAVRPMGDVALAISAFSFGELSKSEDEADVRAAFASLEKLAPKASTFVLVDAGDRARSRRLQRLRDVLTREGRGIAAPCPHGDACPALVRERDWCHTRIAKGLPDKLARFAREVGRDDEAMALSFLVVTKEPRVGDGVVVIGDALKEKGRARLPVCGPAGLRFVQALKRHRAAHDALLATERGVRLSPAVAKAPRNDSRDTAVVDDAATLVIDGTNANAREE